MKKLFLFAFAAMFSAQIFAQAPESFNYQSVVRDGAGNLIVEQYVSFRFSIKEGAAAGPSAYVEKHVVKTNAYGMVNVYIGKGTVVSGSMAGINWANNKHYLKVELDPAGGTTYTNMGTTQMMSVPYALHAKTVEIDNVEDADADSTNEIQTLSLSGTVLSISSGNTVNLSSLLPPTTYTRFASLNDMSRSIVTPYIWTQVSPSFTFTKNHADTKIEALLQSRIMVGNFGAGTNGCTLSFVIDDNPGYFVNTTFLPITTPNSTSYMTLEGFFENLAVGSHTIAIYGVSFDTISNIIFDPGGFSGTIMVKETW